MVNPFDTVHKFERVVAEYANAPYSIATDCCSHAIFLSAIYYKKKHGTCTVEMPKNTYVSAPMQMIHAGFDVDFVDNMADRKLSPIDIDLSGNHFFDRLNDPRNYPDISVEELEDFFDKLSDEKEDFIEFLKKYKDVVVKRINTLSKSHKFALVSLSLFTCVILIWEPTHSFDAVSTTDSRNEIKLSSDNLQTLADQNSEPVETIFEPDDPDFSTQKKTL